MKSSITLPAEEFAIILRLKKKLKIKSNVDVIRKGLDLLKSSELLNRKPMSSKSMQAIKLSELHPIVQEWLSNGDLILPRRAPKTLSKRKALVQRGKISQLIEELRS